MAFLVMMDPPVRAGFCAIGCSGPIPVFEDEPFVRLCLKRGPDLGEAETMECFTEDGSALAGRDYVAQRGTATFAIGQQTTTVEVPLVDNGLLDGPRDFRLVATRRGEFFADYPVEIQDNELRSVVDPLFVPEPGAVSGYGSVASMPAGRIVALDGRLVSVLGPDGSVEHSFDPAPDRACAQVSSLHALSDGRILVGLHGCGEPSEPGELLRFLPTGTLDLMYSVADFLGVAAVQPDGRVLVLTTDAPYAPTLVRLNFDGSKDPSFLPYTELETIYQVAAMDDGRILVGGNGKGDSGPILVRLRPDGSPDRAFVSRTSGAPFLLRANGKLILGMSDPERLTQLEPDGSLDSSFGLEPLYGYSVPPMPVFEGAESNLLATGARSCSGPSFVAQWNLAGRLDWEITFGGSLGSYCGGSPARFLTTTTGQVLMAGGFTSVEGFPRRGLARLLPHPPERDFRVVTPALFRTSVGVASVRVVRTGPTTAAASIAFRTRDGTAVAGRDYVAQSGTVDFVPREVSKEIRVPLLRGDGGDERRSFRLELDQPSPGYAFVETTPIYILPELRIAPESLQPRADGSITLTLHGTLPGGWYSVEASGDLQTWEGQVGSLATGSSLTVALLRAPASRSFFRAFGE